MEGTIIPLFYFAFVAFLGKADISSLFLVLSFYVADYGRKSWQSFPRGILAEIVCFVLLVLLSSVRKIICSILLVFVALIYGAIWAENPLLSSCRIYSRDGRKIPCKRRIMALYIYLVLILCFFLVAFHDSGSKK